MNETSPFGRTGRLLQSTCLAAGLAALVLPFAAYPASAQSAVKAFSAIPASSSAFGGSDQGTGPDGAENQDPAAVLKAGKRSKKADTASEPLNAASVKLSGNEDDLQPDEDVPGSRENIRTAAVDDIRPRLPVASTDTPGIRLGSFILRPSLTTSIGNETTKSPGSSVSRSFGQAELKGTLTSDWSLHQLTITGDGTYQRNIAGTGQTDPSLTIGADLRLDLPSESVAHLTGGYALTRESATDPNAVLGAIDQSAVQTLSAGGSIERNFGLLRGLAALDLSRTTYGDVTLSDGSKSSLEDRNRNAGNLRLRVGYELSPALIPFLEVSAGRTIFDDDADALGYRRNATSYAGKGGVQVDLGEKLKGELGLGYERVTLADARLAAIDAVVLDAAASWSPRRGTDITAGLATSVEPSFVAGQSGYINRTLTVAVNQEIVANLSARLNGGMTWRNYRPDNSAASEVISTAGAGLTYGINRYLDLTGDVSWERTTPDGGQSTDVLRAGLGLTLKR